MLLPPPPPLSLLLLPPQLLLLLSLLRVVFIFSLLHAVLLNAVLLNVATIPCSASTPSTPYTSTCAARTVCTLACACELAAPRYITMVLAARTRAHRGDSRSARARIGYSSHTCQSIGCT
uniref:Uncharacterized protein n=1 Tax=Haptolina brevifila TaxID=156173 RepID=A0A7S2CSQ3_9EUKA